MSDIFYFTKNKFGLFRVGGDLSSAESQQDLANIVQILVVGSAKE